MAITYDAIIIGGGITGLTAAYQLQKKGLSVRLIDSSTPGGLIRSRIKDGFSLELGANTLVLTQPMEELLSEVGLRERVRFPAIEKYRQYVKFNGTITEVPKSPPKFLTSPLFSAVEKVRILKGLSKKLKRNELRREESVAEFFARLLGSAPGDKVIAPVLRGIFGGDLNELHIGAVFPKLFAHLEGGGSLFSYGQSQRVLRRKIFCLEGGNEAICHALRKELSESVVSAKVTALHNRSDSFGVKTEDDREWRGTRVIVATAGRASAEFLSDLDQAQGLRGPALRYAPIVALHFSIPRKTPLPVDGFGVLFPKSGNSTLLGIMFNSLIFPHVAPSERHLVTVCLGGVGNERIIAESDETLLGLGATALASEIGCTASLPLSLQRWEYGIPQYDDNHRLIERNYRALESRHPGLYFIGADNGGVGVPNRVERAFEIALSIELANDTAGMAPRLDHALP